METNTPHDGQMTAAELKTRLDDLRVRLHLGGMDARDKFEALSHEVTEVGRKVGQASREAAKALMARIREFEATLVSHD